MSDSSTYNDQVEQAIEDLRAGARRLFDDLRAHIHRHRRESDLIKAVEVMNLMGALITDLDLIDNLPGHVANNCLEAIKDADYLSIELAAGVHQLYAAILRYCVANPDRRQEGESTVGDLDCERANLTQNEEPIWRALLDAAVPPESPISTQPC